MHSERPAAGIGAVAGSKALTKSGSIEISIENPTLTGFAIYSAGGGLDATVLDPEPTPDGEKFVGNITASGNIRNDFIDYWNQMTPENEGKWGSVEGF